jgi:rSAM/selenodomain-associated transferase 2
LTLRSLVSVIVPVLNGAETLGKCLDSVAGAAELIVVDGGSTDDSPSIAAARGARVLTAAPSRGGQLRTGAAAATSPFLLLLHADTVLTPDWAETLPQGQAGYFTLRFDDPSRAARRLEAIVAWRCRALALPYGDQGLLIPADLLRDIGGVPDIPLMEDVALVRRLGRRRLRALPAVATTSAARYRGGYMRRSLRNLLCLGLYYAKVPPRKIKKFYK